MKSNFNTLFKKREHLFIAAGFAAAIIFLVSVFIYSERGKSIYWLVPPLLLLLLTAVLDIEKFLLLVLFLVPSSIQLRFIIPGTSADLFLPTEPMLAVILVLMIFKLFVSREIDRKILLHPAAMVIYVILVWSVITSLAGTMPFVSLKSLLTRVWFIAAFFLLAASIFRRRGKTIAYFGAYIAGMLPVVIFYLLKMQTAGLLNQSAAYQAIRPFFNDHTSFGASLAFCIPLLILFISQKGNSFFIRFLLLVILTLFTAAFILSYSRAAWLSLAVSAVISVIIALRINRKIVIPALAVAAIITAASWQSIILRMGDIRQESSGKITEHLQSIANIRTDVSNMERINRWKSALRMSAERPLLGWGPGTYQFNYAPFQVSTEKTEISTNWGEGGNAHSEYLGALAESGIPGALLYIILLIVIFARGLKLYRDESNSTSAMLILALLGGLMTYVVHGALNNFLDTDKISALFWGAAAAIVSMDIEAGAEEGDSSQ
jgi:O-antigen ligase